MFPSGEPGVSGDFWGSQEGCQGPSRPSGRNRGLPLRRRRGQGSSSAPRRGSAEPRPRPTSWQDEAIARDGVSREVPCSALKGETVPDSLPATPKSPPTRRVPPRGTPRVPAPRGCIAGSPGESGLILCGGIELRLPIELLRSQRQQPTRLPCPWDSPGKNTGVGCHSLLQGIFLIQGSNPDLPHCRQMLYYLSYLL